MFFLGISISDGTSSRLFQYTKNSCGLVESCFENPDKGVLLKARKNFVKVWKRVSFCIFVSKKKFFSNSSFGHENNFHKAATNSLPVIQKFYSVKTIIILLEKKIKPKFFFGNQESSIDNPAEIFMLKVR